MRAHGANANVQVSCLSFLLLPLEGWFDARPAAHVSRGAAAHVVAAMKKHRANRNVLLAGLKLLGYFTFDERFVAEAVACGALLVMMAAIRACPSSAEAHRIAFNAFSALSLNSEKNRAAIVALGGDRRHFCRLCPPVSPG